MSEILKKAQQYEAAHMNEINEEERPAYHVTGGIGWINDPNGFSVYQNRYHLFYQYHPYSTEWGPMHWGHVVSDDLVQWERLPIAMAPDMPYDDFGVFSGSACEDKEGRHVLVYTGVSMDGEEMIQQQCLAVGDGIVYTKEETNPIISSALVPAGYSKKDFRDPKIWMENGRYYLIAGSTSDDHDGAVQLFASEDLKNWKFCATVDQGAHEYGTMWECPDFFALDGKQVLLTSPTEMTQKGIEFNKGHGVLCLIGDYNPETYAFDRKHAHAIEYGIDFYAPQTLLAPDGRRIMIAWMQSWRTSRIVAHDRKWFACMTIARELSVRNGRLYQNPVRELEQYRTEEVTVKGAKVKQLQSFEGIRGRVADITFDISAEKLSAFTIRFAEKDGHYVEITAHPEEGYVRFDRTHGAAVYETDNVRDIPVSFADDKVRIRALLDRSGIELFFNDGAAAASFRIYGDDSADGISMCADSTVNVDIRCAQLKF